MASSENTGFGAFRVELAALLSTEHVLKLATAFELSRTQISELKEHSSAGLRFIEFIIDKGIINSTNIDNLTDKLIELRLNGVASEVQDAWDLSKPRRSKSEGELYSLKDEEKRSNRESTASYSVTQQKPKKSRRVGFLHFPKLRTGRPFHKGKGKLSTNSCTADHLIEDTSQDETVVTEGRGKYLGSHPNFLEFGLTDMTSENNSFATFLDRLGLLRILNIWDILKLRTFDLHMSPITLDNVVHMFLSHLMSYDYRAPYVFAHVVEIEVKSPAREHAKRDSGHWLTLVTTDESHLEGIPAESVPDRISCRDGVFATILRSDPFLLQEILTKMTSCQLAVPLLLPNPLTGRITMLLWGLRQIRKSWAEDSGKVRETLITEDEFPTVAFVRLGDPDVSKSTILNLILGSVQGKDDHPFFLSKRHDVQEPQFSKGVLEALWFQPNHMRQMQHSISSATCFLNLRGDAREFSLQQKFACGLATLVVIFINSSNVHEYQELIDNISQTTNVLLVSFILKVNKNNTESSQKITVCNIGTRNDKLIAELLCGEISYSLSKHVQNQIVPQCSLEKKGVQLCQLIGIGVDVFGKECQMAIESANKILSGAKTSPKEYKARSLPLQKGWRKWTKVDKDRSWQTNDNNVEESRNQKDLSKRKHRNDQLEIGASKQIQEFFEYLVKANDIEIQFFTGWLHILLNEISQTTLSELIFQIQILGRESRNTKRKIASYYSEIEEIENISEKDKKAKIMSVTQLEAEEEQIKKDRSKVAQEFDDATVGFEHFMREVGQLFESQCEAKRSSIKNRSYSNKDTLPKLAARLLLLGQPIEILDGDACHVPVLWVKGLLQAVQSQIGFDAKLFVISVLGIQSSGKSTLLNSMFGVRFAVSAGRCTRGVYMQMLEVDENLRVELGCDFLIIVDTEGLRAPEKSISGTPDLDNELATFALCISNVTLINIGGQTVGDDLTDVLQVAAHAFIRMKQVELQSSCRIVQQFVADLTARAKNENSTQSIKQKLDEAVRTAAKEEGMHRRYRQFTDVFNILNDDDERDLQYIPSLWRSSTAPPNHSYSEKVLELKSSILDGIKHDNTRFLNILEFGERIEDVWNAVKEEDFVFNFRNSIIMAQYKTFQELYQKLKIDLRKETMSFELERRDQISNASAERIEETLLQAKLDLGLTINEKHDEAKIYIQNALESNNFSEVKRLYNDQFMQDLQFFKQATVNEMEIKLDMIAQKARKKKQTEDTHLPKLRAELRERVFSVAKDLRLSYSNELREGKHIPEEKIKGQFDDVWKACMKKIESSCSSHSDIEIREHINDMLRMCIQKNVDQTHHAKFLRDEVQSREGYHSFSGSSGNVYDKEDVLKLIPYFRDGDINNIDSVYRNITEIVKQNPTDRQTDYVDNILSHDILQKLLVEFKEMLKGINLQDTNDIQWRFTCVLGFTIFLLQEKWKNHFGQLNPDFRKDNELSSTSDTIETINVTITNILERKLTPGKLAIAWRVTKELFGIGTSSRQTSEEFLPGIQTLLKELQYDHISYDSDKHISEFLDSAIQIVESNVASREQRRVLKDICSDLADSIYRKIESSKLDRRIIEEKYPQYNKGCQKIKKTIINIVEDFRVLQNLNEIEEYLSAETIQKLANLPQNSVLQKAIDSNIFSKLEKHQTVDYKDILTQVRSIKLQFLMDITNNDSTENALISVLINNTQRKFLQLLETDEGASMILHMCAWALPLCTAVQISYEKKHDLVLHLEKTKDKYYEDFKNWCLDSANDTRQAEELMDLVTPALLVCVKNKICTSLFGLLAHQGEIFKSRQHLIRHMLQQLAQDEDFKKYLLFVTNHNQFTQNWITKYVAKVCSKRTTKLDIDKLAYSEISRTVDVTRQSFIESWSSDEDDVLSPQTFLDKFRTKCKKKYAINMDENGFDTLKKCSTIKNYKIYKKDFLKLLEKLPSQLLQNLRIPRKNDINEMETWLQRLPVQLDIELGKRVEGCKMQCPFCGSVCDETTKKHNKHFATLHYPNGIKNTAYKTTKRLSCSVCTSNVASSARYWDNCRCNVEECECEWFYYKEYEKKYPDWHIRPIPDTEPTPYWKWVFTRFNKEFAERYQRLEAKIPDTWKDITKKDALESLFDCYP